MATDFSIPEFLAWARTKPADEVYNVNNPSVCALGQYGTATGRNFVCASPEYKLGIRGLERALGFGQNSDAWTFGQLVTRLEALLPAPVISDTWTRPDAYLSDLDERVSA